MPWVVEPPANQYKITGRPVGSPLTIVDLLAANEGIGGYVTLSLPAETIAALINAGIIAHVW